MSLTPLVGHEQVTRRIAESHAAGRLPQVLLITGPRGVGRQRLGLWIAQLIFCERPANGPCGNCRPCGLVAGLGHPDLHWFVPIPRPKAGDPDKQMDEAAETLAELMTERRQQPLWTPPDGMALHGVASARLLQRKAAMRPVEGQHSVILVGDAERLVPQESSQEAANTLLKLLEEPPAGMTLILTAVEPGGVLPTIRSRAVPVRLGRLPDATVAGFLREHAGVAEGIARERARSAEGAIGRALAEDATSAKADQAAAGLLDAVLRGPSEALELAVKQGPWQARGEFTAMLDALARQLGDAARVSASGPGVRPVTAALKRPRPVSALVAAIERVQTARGAAQGNVNPQLLLAGLCADLAEVL
ncbi:MAG: ATP-binding protein [Gemmatimonadales bacterium]